MDNENINDKKINTEEEKELDLNELEDISGGGFKSIVDLNSIGGDW